MEPRIQYAKTEDGVNIAYWTMGRGEPLVLMTGGPSHLQRELNRPDFREWVERAAEGRMLVRYDDRGFGLSDRDVTAYSLDGLIEDLRAVVDHLGLETFALFGPGPSGLVAIAYAANYPERISRLILWCSFPRGSDLWRPKSVRAMRAMREEDWITYTELTDNSPSAGTDTAGEFLRDAVTADTYKAYLELVEKLDVADLLPQLTAPTLILHRREIRTPEFSAARELASTIPDAQLTVIDGTSMRMAVEPDQMLASIRNFLDDGEEEAAAPPATGDTHTILFTDMESSTALTQSLGDAKAQELVRAHNTIVRKALSSHDGTEIKHTGDGIMASFAGASSALGCAVAIQKAVAARAAQQPDIPLGLRVGLNAGEPVVEEQDLFGASVQLARRICDHAEPGQILASNVVRELAMGKGFLFGDIGEVVPKGFEEPVRLYEVRWREDGS